MATRYQKRFWDKFLRECAHMEMAEWRFDLLHDAHGDLVEDVLQCLEEIVQIAGSIPEVIFPAVTPSLNLASPYS